MLMLDHSSSLEISPLMSVLQAVAGVEVGHKGVAVDDGALGDVRRNAVKVLIRPSAYADFRRVLRIGGAVGSVKLA